MIWKCTLLFATVSKAKKTPCRFVIVSNATRKTLWVSRIHTLSHHNHHHRFSITLHSTCMDTESNALTKQERRMVITSSVEWLWFSHWVGTIHYKDIEKGQHENIAQLLREYAIVCTTDKPKKNYDIEQCTHFSKETEKKRTENQRLNEWMNERTKLKAIVREKLTSMQHSTEIDRTMSPPNVHIRLRLLLLLWLSLLFTYLNRFDWYVPSDIIHCHWHTVYAHTHLRPRQRTTIIEQNRELTVLHIFFRSIEHCGLLLLSCQLRYVWPMHV